MLWAIFDIQFRFIRAVPKTRGHGVVSKFRPPKHQNYTYTHTAWEDDFAILEHFINLGYWWMIDSYSAHRHWVIVGIEIEFQCHTTSIGTSAVPLITIEIIHFRLLITTFISFRGCLFLKNDAYDSGPYWCHHTHCAKPATSSSLPQQGWQCSRLVSVNTSCTICRKRHIYACRLISRHYGYVNTSLLILSYIMACQVTSTGW